MLIIISAFTSVNVAVPGYLIPTTKDISVLFPAIGCQCSDIQSKV